LNVDIKRRGCESAIVAMLRGHGLLERSLISSQSADIVETVRTVAANAWTAISIGGYISRRANRWHPHAWRERLLHELAAGRFGDVMLHHKLVEAEIAEAIGRLGRRLFAWTVDEPALFARVANLGVAGVATNDPARLRAPALTGVQPAALRSSDSPAVRRRSTSRGTELSENQRTSEHPIPRERTIEHPIEQALANS
jgi:hypothetical protein